MPDFVGVTSLLYISISLYFVCFYLIIYMLTCMPISARCIWYVIEVPSLLCFFSFPFFKKYRFCSLESQYVEMVLLFIYHAPAVDSFLVINYNSLLLEACGLSINVESDACTICHGDGYALLRLNYSPSLLRFCACV